MDIKWQVALMLLQTCLFVMAWYYLHRHVESHGPIRGAARVTTINSRVYAIFSLCLFFIIISPNHEPLARRLYHASKFYEYVDVFNVRASGGKIDLHFGFHHLTTCYLTFARVVHDSRGWKPFAALNALHHALMYAYFGGMQLPRPALPWTGAFQLIVGIVADVQVAREKMEMNEENVWTNVFSGCLLATYLILSTRELLLRGGQEQAAKKNLEEVSHKEE